MQIRRVRCLLYYSGSGKRKCINKIWISPLEGNETYYFCMNIKLKLTKEEWSRLTFRIKRGKSYKDYRFSDTDWSMYIRPNQAYQIRETNGDMTKELVHHSGYHYKLVWAGPLLLLRQRQDSRMDEISRVFYLWKIQCVLYRMLLLTTDTNLSYKRKYFCILNSDFFCFCRQTLL